jgi:hypothetical protein
MSLAVQVTVVIWFDCKVEPAAGVHEQEGNPPLSEQAHA